MNANEYRDKLKFMIEERKRLEADYPTAPSIELPSYRRNGNKIRAEVEIDDNDLQPYLYLFGETLSAENAVILGQWLVTTFDSKGVE